MQRATKNAQEPCAPSTTRYADLPIMHTFSFCVCIIHDHPDDWVLRRGESGWCLHLPVRRISES